MNHATDMTDGTVSSLRASATPMASNEAASLWDFGSGIACFEIHTKMNTLNVQVLSLLEDTIARAGAEFSALVIGNDDSRAFSAGADLSYVHAMIVKKEWPALSDYFGKGQSLYQTLAATPVPIVSAAHGFALGGGCELMLHSHAVVAHEGLRAGLPEIKVGLIPGWGGCTQLLLRCVERLGPENGLAHALQVLQEGSISSSAEQAQAMGLLRSSTHVVKNRAALLPAAVEKARTMMAEGFSPPARPALTYCGERGHTKYLQMVEAAVADGSLDQDRAIVMRELVGILSGFPEVVEQGTHSITVALAEERASANRLVKNRMVLEAVTKLTGR